MNRNDTNSNANAKNNAVWSEILKLAIRAGRDDIMQEILKDNKCTVTLEHLFCIPNDNKPCVINGDTQIKYSDGETSDKYICSRIKDLAEYDKIQSLIQRYNSELSMSFKQENLLMPLLEKIGKEKLKKELLDILNALKTPSDLEGNIAELQIQNMKIHNVKSFLELIRYKNKPTYELIKSKLSLHFKHLQLNFKLDNDDDYIFKSLLATFDNLLSPFDLNTPKNKRLQNLNIQHIELLLNELNSDPMNLTLDFDIQDIKSLLNFLKPENVNQLDKEEKEDKDDKDDKEDQSNIKLYRDAIGSKITENHLKMQLEMLKNSTETKIETETGTKTKIKKDKVWMIKLDSLFYNLLRTTAIFKNANEIILDDLDIIMQEAIKEALDGDSSFLRTILEKIKKLSEDNKKKLEDIIKNENSLLYAIAKSHDIEEISTQLERIMISTERSKKHSLKVGLEFSNILSFYNEIAFNGAVLQPENSRLLFSILSKANDELLYKNPLKTFLAFLYLQKVTDDRKSLPDSEFLLSLKDNKNRLDTSTQKSILMEVIFLEIFSSHRSPFQPSLLVSYFLEIFDREKIEAFFDEKEEKVLNDYSVTIENLINQYKEKLFSILRRINLHAYTLKPPPAHVLKSMITSAFKLNLYNSHSYSLLKDASMRSFLKELCQTLDRVGEKERGEIFDAETKELIDKYTKKLFSDFDLIIFGDLDLPSASILKSVMISVLKLNLYNFCSHSISEDNSICSFLKKLSQTLRGMTEEEHKEIFDEEAKGLIDEYTKKLSSDLNKVNLDLPSASTLKNMLTSVIRLNLYNSYSHSISEDDSMYSFLKKFSETLDKVEEKERGEIFDEETKALIDECKQKISYALTKINFYHLDLPSTSTFKSMIRRVFKLNLYDSYSQSCKEDDFTCSFLKKLCKTLDRMEEKARIEIFDKETKELIDEYKEKLASDKTISLLEKLKSYSFIPDSSSEVDQDQDRVGQKPSTSGSSLFARKDSDQEVKETENQKQPENDLALNQ